MFDILSPQMIRSGKIIFLLTMALLIAGVLYSYPKNPKTQESAGYKVLLASESLEGEYSLPEKVSILRVIVRFDDKGSRAKLTLIQPDGKVIEQTDSVFDVEETEDFLIVELQNPQSGEWKLGITALEVAPGGSSFHYTIVFVW